jgi:hypothetical protein
MIREVLSESDLAASNEDLKALSRLGFKLSLIDDNWIQGKVNIPKIGLVKVHIIRYAKPHKRNIANGRISMLWIFEPRLAADATLAHYELSRWVTQPKEPEVKKFVAQIIKALS